MKSLSQLIELQFKWLNGKDTLAPILSKNLLKNFCLRAVPWGVHWVDRRPNVVMWWYCVRSHTNILALRNPTQSNKLFKNYYFSSETQCKSKMCLKKIPRDFTRFSYSTRGSKKQNRFFQNKKSIFFKTKHFQTWTSAEKPKSARIPSNSKYG